jgi:hypothetical protein
VLAEVYLQSGYFLGLRPDLITSCCGSLFSASGRSLAAHLASFPLEPTRLFFESVAATLALGAYHLRSGAGSYLFREPGKIFFYKWPGALTGG